MSIAMGNDCINCRSGPGWEKYSKKGQNPGDRPGILVYVNISYCFIRIL